MSAGRTMRAGAAMLLGASLFALCPDARADESCEDLLPGRVGLVAGMFFGFSFGMGGLGAAGLGWLADHSSIEMVFRVCAFLPAIGLLTAFLPNLGRERN